MPRIRTVKPEFWLREDLAHVSAEAYLLAVGILNFADDRGVFRANPVLVKASVFPLRSVDASALLAELEAVGYVVITTGPDGVLYGSVCDFLRHQVIDRPSKIKIGDGVSFPEHSTHFRRVLDDDSESTRRGLGVGLGSGSGSGLGGERNGQTFPPISPPTVAGAAAPAPPALVGEPVTDAPRARRPRKARALSPVSLELRDTIAQSVGVTYPDASWDVLESALAAGDLTPDDARAVVAHAATEAWWRDHPRLDPSALFRRKTWPGLLAKGRAQKPVDPVAEEHRRTMDEWEARQREEQRALARSLGLPEDS